MAKKNYFSLFQSLLKHLKNITLLISVMDYFKLKLSMIIK